MIRTLVKEASMPDFDNFQKTVLDYANIHAVRMGLDQNELAQFPPLQAVWTTHYQQCLFPGLTTKADIESRKWARLNLSTPLVNLVEKRIYGNQLVESVDLLSMGLPLPTPISNLPKKLASSEIPKLDVQILKGAVIVLLVKNMQGKRSKPVGAKMLQVKYFIGDNPPIDAKDYPNELLLTSCTNKLKFDSFKQGDNRIHFIARWLGAKGQTSSFCQPLTAYIMK